MLIRAVDKEQVGGADNGSGATESARLGSAGERAGGAARLGAGGGPATGTPLPALPEPGGRQGHRQRSCTLKKRSPPPPPSNCLSFVAAVFFFVPKFKFK